MNRRFSKFLPAVCLCALFAFTFMIAFGQDQSEPGQGPFQRQGRAFGGFGRFTNAVRFDVDIANGQLMLAPIKDRADFKEFWGPAATSARATIANLAKYLSVADTNGNLNVSPSAAEIEIKDLKLRGADIDEVLNAVSTATDGAVHGKGGIDVDGRYHFAFEVFNGQVKPGRTLEVFNMSGFIANVWVSVPIEKRDSATQSEFDAMESLIAETLDSLYPNDPQRAAHPEFKFHKGTKLLIVIGTPEAIDVARKVINAWPGQSPDKAQLLDIPATTQEK